MSTADVFGALANPVRRRVREILANGLQTAVAMSAHAEHLKVLRDAGLVYDEVAGRHRNYRLRGLADSLMSAPIEQGFYHHGDPPYPAASIEDVTAQTGDGTGFGKMGDRTAEYRVWQANCPNEKAPQIHQAWLLPDSDIAIYEQRATEFNDAVVQSMQPLR